MIQKIAWVKGILLAGCLCLASSLFAEENFIEGGAVHLTVRDHFSVFGNEKITDYDAADPNAVVRPNLSFFYGDEWIEDAVFYAKSSRGLVSTGVQLYTDYGKMDLGFKTQLLQQEWENPFTLNVSRKPTNVTEIGYYAGWEFYFVGQNLKILYESSERELEKDNVEKDLLRKGEKEIFSFESTGLVGVLGESGFSRQKVSLENYDAEGKAGSYSSMDYSLLMGRETLDDLFALVNVGVGLKTYEAIHPILNEQINILNRSLFFILRYNELMDNEDLYMSLFLGRQVEDANHEFYNVDNQLIAVSLGTTL